MLTGLDVTGGEGLDSCTEGGLDGVAITCGTGAALVSVTGRFATGVDPMLTGLDTAGVGVVTLGAGAALYPLIVLFTWIVLVMAVLLG